MALAERVAAVRGAIGAAAERAGRPAESVRLMAAVKTRTPSEIQALASEGVVLIGENRVQEGVEHLEALPLEVRRNLEVHFIGRLQANKVRKALLAFRAIDSLDSLSLAERLSRIAREEGLERDVMIEVNLGEESQKGGVAAGDLLHLAEAVQALPGLKLTGIMGVPPYGKNPEASRPFFRRLRELFDEVRRAIPEAGDFGQLSMGMSHDFVMAVEEGATMVRIGTALFGPRRAP
ncbi:MAG: YggS family pyridoxal phosphate-dependent enzyme [Acidobacteriota bacterium]